MKYSLVLLCFLFTSIIFAQNNNSNSLKVTRYKLHPKELNIQNDVSAKKINLKIYYLKEGNITEDYTYFKPKKNEILFFFGKDPVTNTTQMYFKVDENLKHIYKKKEFDKLIKVVEVLEYNVFPTESNFSSIDAYSALASL
ncbi:hypothetical protein CLV86_1524 [Lacinutrix venerupis]|uniref:Uncharacterized protein n=1 Tax=Lacinutrix venerupis TaxID=1486034 RepID=A0AAC9PWE2_9FLAO|nr:hypothetical protein [Lacinutrix venerupis]APY00757.1 hypothetical protein BWR22_10680 [Lacinutrix venerupis]RLJ64406.1 hypothetical protein CLV86_1524 [Lacinutrix venerupis]